MEFDSENINEAFNVRTLKYDRSGPAVFGTNPGDIVSIDIYFQFSSLYNYDSIY